MGVQCWQQRDKQTETVAPWSGWRSSTAVPEGTPAASGSWRNPCLRRSPMQRYREKFGRRSSFEVTVNDSLVHSKLATDKFPDFEETVEMIGKVDRGAEPEKITKFTSGSCIIL